eukprot:6179077-Pleurochrysis_carterae.AAC.1
MAKTSLLHVGTWASLATASAFHWKLTLARAEAQRLADSAVQNMIKAKQGLPHGAGSSDEQATMARRSTSSSSSHVEFSFSGHYDQCRREEQGEKPELRPAGVGLDQENMSFNPSAFNGPCRAMTPIKVRAIVRLRRMRFGVRARRGDALSFLVVRRASRR